MELKNLITSENWTYSGFQSGKLLALINLAAEPSEEGPKVIYLLTVLENLEEEVFQMEFQELKDAIETINKKYIHWEFTDRSEKQGEGGCGSCSAH